MPDLYQEYMNDLVWVVDCHPLTGRQLSSFLTLVSWVVLVVSSLGDYPQWTKRRALFALAFRLFSAHRDRKSHRQVCTARIEGHPA
jgi:hypothetical protein